MFLQALRKRQRAVAQCSPLKKKDSFSCRHYCFPDFSRAELEGKLNHFWSCGRHFDWRRVPFVRRRCSGKVGEPFLLGCRLCSIVHVTVTCGCAFQVTPSTNTDETAYRYAGEKKPLWCQRYLTYDAKSLFFVGFLTHHSLHRRNHHIRCPYEDALCRRDFCLLFVGFPTTTNQRETGYRLEPTHAARARVHGYLREERTSECHWSGNMLQFHVSCFFLLFFLSMSVMNTMMFNRSHYLTIRKWLSVFPKPKLLLSKLKKRANFLHRWVCSPLG